VNAVLGAAVDFESAWAVGSKKSVAEFWFHSWQTMMGGSH
jgi:hypothetical protein